MPRLVWKNIFYVYAYQLAKQGLSNKKIAEAIGVDRRTFQRWITEKKTLRKSLNMGRNGTQIGMDGKTWIDYVYKHLSPKVKKYWDQISEWEHEKDGGRKIHLLLENVGTFTRQQLFVHALVDSNFNPSEACRKVGITKRCYTAWAEKYPQFADLIDELKWHRENFVEGALLNLVEKGSEAATIFANRTINRHRGYDMKQDVEVKGSVMHAHFDMNKLLDMVSVEAKREILAAARQMREGIADKPADTNPIVRINSKVRADDHDSIRPE